MLTRSVSSPALRHLTLLFLALVFVTACAPSETPDVAESVPPSPEQEAVSPRSGVVEDQSGASALRASVGSAVRVVYLDPATGQLTSTRPEGAGFAEDLAAAEEGVGNFHEGVEVIHHDNGIIQYTRPEGFQVKLMATLDEEGNLTVRHTTERTPAAGVESEEVAHDR